jgi:hypothetical protein
MTSRRDFLMATGTIPLAGTAFFLTTDRSAPTATEPVTGKADEPKSVGGGGEIDLQAGRTYTVMSEIDFPAGIRGVNRRVRKSVEAWEDRLRQNRIDDWKEHGIVYPYAWLFDLKEDCYVFAARYIPEKNIPALHLPWNTFGPVYRVIVFHNTPHADFKDLANFRPADENPLQGHIFYNDELSRPVQAKELIAWDGFDTTPRGNPYTLGGSVLPDLWFKLTHSNPSD